MKLQQARRILYLAKVKSRNYGIISCFYDFYLKFVLIFLVLSLCNIFLSIETKYFMKMCDFFMMLQLKKNRSNFSHASQV